MFGIPWNPFERLEMSIMAGVNELKSSLAALSDKIDAEHAEVASILSELNAAVADLKAKLDAVTEVDLSEEVATVEALTAKVAAIYEAPAPEVPAEPVE